MNKGVEMLISRMQSNPDEFKPYGVGGGGKWERLLNDWASCIDEEDMKSFRTALRETHQKLFTQQVMKYLLHVDEAESVTLSTGATQGSWGVTGIVNPAYQAAQQAHNAQIAYNTAQNQYQEHELRVEQMKLALDEYTQQRKNK